MPAADLIVDLAIRYGFQVLGALAILAVGAVVARWCGQVLDRRLQVRGMEPPMRLLLVRSARLVVLAFALLVALDKFGFQIAPLVAGIGVAGVGLGLALQGVLSNVMAGLTIIFTKPFRVGEYIEILGVHGDVAAIELFSTTLVHPDRSRVIIPNRKIVGEILHNFGRVRQLRLVVPVPRADDVERVLAVIREVVHTNPRVLKDPAPMIGISTVNESGVQIGISPWVKVPDVVPAQTEIFQAVVKRFRETGVTVPMSPLEIRVVNGPSSPAVNP